MADLFISYARADRSRVAPLVAALEAEGFSVWWDPEIDAGQEFDRLIADELDKARAVVVVWTPVSVESVWVRGEAREGRERRVLVPARFDNARLPIDMRAIHATDLDGWNEDRDSREFRQLVRAIRALTSEQCHLGPSAKMAQSLGLGPGTDAPARRAVRRRLAWTGAAAAVLTIAALGAFILTRSPAAAGPPGIAVMPFQTASGDTLERGFVQGVVARVTEGLAKANLKVVQGEGAASDSAARRAEAARLGAQFVVDGLATRSNDHQMVVDAHLDDARDGQLLWSGHFDRPDSESQAMQEQVAAKIADIAHCAVDADSLPEGHLDSDSLGLYLKACDLAHTDSGELQVRDLLRQVVQRQPRFAKAWSSLAAVSVRAATDGSLPSDQAGQERVNARKYASRALALDPKNGDVYAALVDLELTHDWQAREALIARGLALAPDNAELLYQKAQFLSATGRIRDAALNAQRAADIDPLSPEKTMQAAMIVSWAYNLPDAETMADRAVRVWPDNQDVWNGRMAILARQGDPQQALAVLKANPPPADPSGNLVQLWQVRIKARIAHDPAEVLAHGKLALSRTPGLVGLHVLNLLMVGAVGDAFDILASYPPGPDFDTTILFRPYAEGMRHDPRFMPLAANLGLVAYWRQSNNWPDFCLPPQKTYDCTVAAAALDRPNVAGAKQSGH